MVFGNKGADSGSGVAFSRDEITGAPEPSGDFLVNAQGEDVVSGVRNTQTLDEMARLLPGRPRRADRSAADAGVATTATCRTSSSRSRRAGSTCCRPATRSGPPRRRFASRWTPSPRGCSTGRARSATIDAGKLDALLHPTFDPEREYEVLTARRRRLAGRGARRDRVHRRRGRRAGRLGRGRDPGAPLHRGRGRRGVRRGAGDPHLRGRQGLARGARRARHGEAVRVRRIRARCRPRRRAWCTSTAGSCAVAR